MTHPGFQHVAYHEAFFSENEKAQAKSPYKFNIKKKIKSFMLTLAQEYCFKKEILEAHSASWNFLHVDMRPRVAIFRA